jgi:hypothetical protein
MQKTQNITIIMLLMTAAILSSLLVAGWLYTEPAYAGGTSRSGDYIMASGQYDAETDFIYVLDIANAKLNLYYPNINTNQLTLGTWIDLGAAFRAGPR